MPPLYDDIADALALNQDGFTHEVTLTLTDSTFQNNEDVFGDSYGVWLSLDLTGETGVVQIAFNVTVDSGTVSPWLDVFRLLSGYDLNTPEFRGPSTNPLIGKIEWIGDSETQWSDPPGGLQVIEIDLDNVNHQSQDDLYYIHVGDLGFADVTAVITVTYAYQQTDLNVPCQSFGRFYESPPWRIVVTSLESETITFLDKLATNRRIAYPFNAPAVLSADVPSDNPEVNILWPTEDADSEPFVAEGVRLVYAFRRECGVSNGNQPTETPWVVRFGGILMETDDQAQDNPAVTGFTAYDPWMYLYRRPVLDPDTLDLPTTETGLTYLGQSADLIIQEQLNTNALAWPLTYPHEFMALDWGQSAFYNGTMESTDTIEEITFQRGCSLGEMLDMLRDTGTCDIRIDAVYDPINRPGFVGELSVFAFCGSFKPDAVFGWDKFPRSLTGITRHDDGTQRANRIKFYAGMGGVPIGLQEDVDSQSRVGVYYEQRFWPNQTSQPATAAMAAAQLALVKEGLRTYTLTPAAERAPLPFDEYWLGDLVPVWASRNFRDNIDGLALRVEGVTFSVGDDQLERVDELLVAVDDFSGEVEPLISGSEDVNADDTPIALTSAIGIDDVITLSYNYALDDTNTPPTTAYAVTVAASPVTVTDVDVSTDGNSVLLTLASPITPGDVVDVDYTPTGTPLMSTLGETVPALTNQSVSTGGGGPGAPRDILTARMTGIGGDNGDGKPGLTYRWLVATSSNTQRTNGGNAGRYFVEGETWCFIIGSKPYGSGSLLKRIHNWHDMPFAGYVWGEVSPVAQDYNAFAETEGSTNHWFTLQYAQTSANKHTLVPLRADEWNWEFVRILFHRTNGSVQVWLRNSVRGAALGTLVNLSGVRTLNPDPDFYNGAQFWQGLYNSGGYYGPRIQIDHMAAMVGRTWDAAWNDDPSYVEDFGSPQSTYTTIASVSTADILLPDDIAGQIIS